jgi:hypothetical protein
MIHQLVFMTEETSMEAFLNIALNRLLPDNLNFMVIPHEGKQDLEKSIPIKLRAWKNNAQTHYRFIIIRDKDSGDCVNIKKKLRSLCVKAGQKDAIIIIAIHELESWFIGDLHAIEVSYKITGLHKKQYKNPYRNPDSIANASERLFKLSKDKTKVARARKITKEMNFQENKSCSFQYFLSKIEELSTIEQFA